VLDGASLPLQNVIVRSGSAATLSDAQGRFLLSELPAGYNLVHVDARQAGVNYDSDHGYYEVRMAAMPGTTTALDYTMFLPQVDHSQDVEIPSPTVQETVVTHTFDPWTGGPHPGRHGDQGGPDGTTVTRLNNHGLPGHRAALPVALCAAQGAVLPRSNREGHASSSRTDRRERVGSSIPTTRRNRPRARTTFFRYDIVRGWIAYGGGSINADGSQNVPDPGVVITEFRRRQLCRWRQGRWFRCRRFNQMPPRPLEVHNERGPIPPVFRSLACAALLALGCQVQAARADAPPSSGSDIRTALTGRVLTADGTPLANVAIADGSVRTKTGTDGRFELAGIVPGDSVLVIDGHQAGADRMTDYGYYEAAVSAVAGRTTALGSPPT